jgi:hypothetical protein
MGGSDDGTGQPINVIVHDGVAIKVRYQNGNLNGSFSCTTDCTGMTVSAPDADGKRTITFDDTVLHEDQSFPLPGPRTFTLKSGPIVFPAP